MTEKNGILTFECDKDAQGNELLNSSQRNNEIVWPSPSKFPNAQYRTSWKNTCNCTSYIMALEYAGYIFPVGPYKQPEDNLALSILQSDKIMARYQKEMPAMYKSFLRCKNGQCSAEELKNVCFPIELHDYLCARANEWIGTTAAKFSTNVNFKKALWRYFVKDNLPMVISTTFGGFGHIVCVTGVQYAKSDFEKGKAIEAETKENPEVTPVAIIVDDPWGDASKSKFEKYPEGGGCGNDIIVPWDIVVKKVKPAGSDCAKWAHVFNHAAAII